MLHAGRLLGVAPEWFGFLLHTSLLRRRRHNTILNLIGLNTDLIGLNTSAINIE